MAYVSQFGDDIFISYAHVDDETVSETGQGWVTETVKCLKMELARKLGRNDAYSLMSVAADFAVTQVVDGRQGVHVRIPRAIFPTGDAGAGKR